MPDRDGPGDPDRDDEQRLADAADVLYRMPPDRFVAERDRLVRAARAADDRDHARALGGLGRPTRAAWVLNLLARESPDVVGPLVELGAALREAQRDLDAATLRTLSDQRRALAREVAGRAFDLAGEEDPSAALRAEVQDTLTAAVVDPDVGAALSSGRLLKATQASGFGPTGPALAAVPDRPARGPTGARTATRGRTAPPGQGSAPPRESPAAAKERRAAERAQAQAEREQARREEREAAERRRRVEAAEAAVEAARAALERARADEAEARERVRILSEQLADARRATGDAGLAVREAQAEVREAERAHRAALH